MKRILVPTDFSENAHNALPYAIAVANRFGSEIVLLHTYQVQGTTGMFVSIENYLKKDSAEAMLGLVREVERQLEGGATIETRIIRGDTVPIISGITKKEKFDLVIMGTQGASGLQEVFFGSVTHGVIKQVDTPVLAIPSQYVFRPFSKAVLAIDEQGIPFAKTVQPLLSLIKAFQASLAVYHKDTGSNDVGISPSVEAFLDEVEYSLYYELDTNQVNESIRSFVNDAGADLLCMIRRRQTGFLERIFHSSHTSKKVFNSPVPLLILQADDQ